MIVALLVLAQTQMVEQDIARLGRAARHASPPRQLFVERRVEQLLDPRRIQIFGVRDSRYRAPARRLLPRDAASAALCARTTMSRVTVPHSGAAPLRASFACQVPAAGEATSANQK